MKESLMSEERHILICDDEPDLREMVARYLEKRGFRVSLAENGAALQKAFEASDDIDAVVLDINMPGDDGLTVLRRLRENRDTPVIMATAAGETVDRVIGLEMGADDYLSKPMDLRELEARIKTVLRRAGKSHANPASAAAPVMAAIDGLKVDLEGAKLYGRNGDEISLTAMEFRLLKVFIEHSGRVLNRDQLLELAHDRGWDPFDRSVDIRISRLRRKIERNPSSPELIRTVRGIGYVFDGKDD